MANNDDQLAMAAGAGVGGAPTVAPRVRQTPPANAWARHAREDLQGTHSLTTPLVRWAPELVEAAPVESLDREDDVDIAIPASVLHARPPLRLPEDAVGRSPIAGQVVAVWAAAGHRVTRHKPVMVIEAMKMENQICPEVDGVLKAVHVAPGDAVKAGQVLFEVL